MKYKYEDEEFNVYKYEDDHRCKKVEYKKEEHKKMEESGCCKLIKKDVSLVAMVKVKPIICVRDIEVKCVGHVHLEECKKHNIKKECEFCIKQDMTLRIPVRFDAETEVKDQGIVCHPEEHEHCDE